MKFFALKTYSLASPRWHIRSLCPLAPHVGFLKCVAAFETTLGICCSCAMFQHLPIALLVTVFFAAPENNAEWPCWNAGFEITLPEFYNYIGGSKFPMGVHLLKMASSNPCWQASIDTAFPYPQQLEKASTFRLVLSFLLSLACLASWSSNWRELQPAAKLMKGEFWNHMTSTSYIFIW